jgi:hypothetical protein
VIFRLIEAHRNEIRSQLPLFEAKSWGCPPRSAGTRWFAFIKAHLCRLRLPHLTPSAGHAGSGGARSRTINDAVLWRPGTLSPATIEKVQRDIETSANSAGVRVQLVGADGAEDFDAAFSMIKASSAEGLIVLVNPVYFLYRKHIIDRAADNRLSAIYEWKAFAQSGGLISYGAVVADVYRRAAGYVDKILKGAKPGDLLVEGPKRTELVVNLETAKELGLTVPQSLLAQADAIIEK